MAENPQPPPRQFVDVKTGLLTENAFRWLEARSVSTDTDIGSVVSGVAQARSEAARAQATANAASQTAQDTQSNAFSVTVDSSDAFSTSGDLGPQTTNAVTVTASGGTAPYTYAWAKVSGDTVGIDSPTAATTTFTDDPGFANTLSGVYRCTVTDNVAATASITVGVTITQIGV